MIYHQRHRLRLQGFDYAAPRAYFLTVVCANRECLFGEIIDGEMCLNDLGAIVKEDWMGLPDHFPNVVLDEFMVMPDHFHGIVFLNDASRHAIPTIMQAFKSFTTRRINEGRNSQGARIWQRSYHDRIIRNEKELNALREYIQWNPMMWGEDSEDP